MLLYVLVKSNGDGSYSAKYTLNPKHIEILQKAYDQDMIDADGGLGVDGDGFGYDTINVPDDSTYKSLGIRWPITDDDLDFNFDDNEDE
jgi:hypothetical protein